MDGRLQHALAIMDVLGVLFGAIDACIFELDSVELMNEGRD